MGLGRRPEGGCTRGSESGWSGKGYGFGLRIGFDGFDAPLLDSCGVVLDSAVDVLDSSSYPSFRSPGISF